MTMGTEILILGIAAVLVLSIIGIQDYDDDPELFPTFITSEKLMLIKIIGLLAASCIALSAIRNAAGL